MKEPVDHIERPRLPWRDNASMTECGHDASKVKTLTRDEFFSRLLEYGTQRTAILTCMTCMQTAKRWSTWHEDPRQALEREIQWEGCGKYSHNQRGTQLRSELRAMDMLIKKHRAEFEWLLLEVETACDAAPDRNEYPTR